METTPGQGRVETKHYFFGRRCGSLQRRQRVFCELILPPHFGQRRLLSFMTNPVRGRIPIMILTTLQIGPKFRNSSVTKVPPSDKGETVGA